MGRLASKGILVVVGIVFVLGGGAAVANFFNQPEIAVYLDKQREDVVTTYQISGTVVGGEVSASAVLQ